MAGPRALKQWTLTKNETLNSFTNWKENLLYTLSLDNNFAPFLADGVTWDKKSNIWPTRGLRDDTEAVPEARRRTAAQKCAHLELLLGKISNYAVDSGLTHHGENVAVDEEISPSVENVIVLL